jgi:hypothetical protein
MADSQVPWGVDALGGSIFEPAWWAMLRWSPEDSLSRLRQLSPVELAGRRDQASAEAGRRRVASSSAPPIASRPPASAADSPDREPL